MYYFDQKKFMYPFIYYIFSEEYYSRSRDNLSICSLAIRWRRGIIRVVRRCSPCNNKFDASHLYPCGSCNMLIIVNVLSLLLVMANVRYRVALNFPKYGITRLYFIISRNEK